MNGSMSSRRIGRRLKRSAGHVVILSLVALWFLADVGSAFFLPMPTYVGQEVEFDLQITVPYTIAMPTWVGRKRRKRQMNDGEGDSFDRRMAPLSTAVDDRIGFERYDDEEELMEEYDLTSKEGATLARLDSLFDWLGLTQDACRHRLLCFVTQDPVNYSPLSDVILQHMDPRREEMFIYDVEEPGMRRFSQFYTASKKGLSSDTNCTLETPSCPHSPDQLLDWDTLRRVQQFSRLIKLRFNDY